MNHLQVSGEHWDIGFQWGSLLAQRGILIWERIPFPLTPERRAFAQRCRPIYQTFLHSEEPRLPFQESLKERRGLFICRGAFPFAFAGVFGISPAVPAPCSGGRPLGGTL